MSRARPVIQVLGAGLWALLWSAGCGEYQGGTADSQFQQSFGREGGLSGLSSAQQVSAFEDTVHPLLSLHCNGCHAPGGQGVPKFADANPTAAFSAVVDNGKVNFNVPASSRLSQRLLQPHNCWGDCQQNSDEMTLAIEAWVSAIEAAGGSTGSQLTVDGIASDVRNIDRDGALDDGGNRYKANLIALWEFKEGSGNVAHDTSGVAPAIQLVLERSTFMSGYGVEVSERGLAKAGSAESVKLYDHIARPGTGTGQYTVEAWVAPSNITQGDNARVVTYSLGGEYRNFALVQNQYNYGFRNRTINPDTDDNGLPALSTRDEDEDAQATLQHVVITYDQYRGRRIYVDGVFTDDVDEQTPGRLWNWAPNHRLVIGNEHNSRRPWKGQVRLVAIYKEAISDAAISQNFVAGVGKTSRLAFDISQWAGAAASVSFAVSSLDDYHYLFCQPTISGSNVSGMRVKNLRIAINGNSPSEMGQAFSKLDSPVFGSTYQLSRGCTMVETQLGSAEDGFQLVFEELGPFADPEDPQRLAYEMSTFAYEPGELPPTNGMRDFARVNETMADLTGVDPRDVEDVFLELEQQLPGGFDARAFVSSHQVGISKLALEYCDAMIEDPVLREDVFGAGFGFDQDPSVAFAAGSAEITGPLVDRMMGQGLASQPASADVQADLDGLISLLMGSCDAVVCSGGERTRNIVKGACTAMLGSAAVMVH